MGAGGFIQAIKFYENIRLSQLQAAREREKMQKENYEQRQKLIQNYGNQPEIEKISKALTEISANK